MSSLFRASPCLARGSPHPSTSGLHHKGNASLPPAWATESTLPPHFHAGSTIQLPWFFRRVTATGIRRPRRFYTGSRPHLPSLSPALISLQTQRLPHGPQKASHVRVLPGTLAAAHCYPLCLVCACTGPAPSPPADVSLCAPRQLPATLGCATSSPASHIRQSHTGHSGQFLFVHRVGCFGLLHWSFSPHGQPGAQQVPTGVGWLSEQVDDEGTHLGRRSGPGEPWYLRGGQSCPSRSRDSEGQRGGRLGRGRLWPQLPASLGSADADRSRIRLAVGMFWSLLLRSSWHFPSCKHHVLTRLSSKAGSGEHCRADILLSQRGVAPRRPPPMVTYIPLCSSWI